MFKLSTCREVLRIILVFFWEFSSSCWVYSMSFFSPCRPERSFSWSSRINLENKLLWVEDIIFSSWQKGFSLQLSWLCSLQKVTPSSPSSSLTLVSVSSSWLLNLIKKKAKIIGLLPIISSLFLSAVSSLASGHQEMLKLDFGSMLLWRFLSFSWSVWFTRFMP